MLRMLNRQPHLLMLRLGIVEDLADIEYTPTGHTCFVELCYPMRNRLLPDLFIQLCIDGLAIGKAQRVVGKLRTLPQMLEIKRGQQFEIKRIITRCDRNLTIRGLKQPIG